MKGLVHRRQKEGEEDEKSQKDKEASKDKLEGPEDENDPVEEGFGGLLKLMPRPGKNQVWVTCETYAVFYKLHLPRKGKSMTPCRGNTIFFRSSQQLLRLRIGPSKGFLS